MTKSKNQDDHHDKDITEELVKEIAKRKPLRTVLPDSGYSNDSVKISVEQIFKLLSPSTEVKSIENG